MSGGEMNMAKQVRVEGHLRKVPGRKARVRVRGHLRKK